VAYFEVGASAGGLGATRWGHLSPHVLIGAIVSCIVLVLRPLPPGSVASLLAPAILVTGVLFSWLAMRQHDSRLCEYCVAAMPMNPAEAASRYRGRLAVAHLGSDRKVVAAYLLVLVGSSVFLVDGSPALRVVGPYLWSAVQATMIYLVLCHTTHRRLQPWCPQCRGDDGDQAVDRDPTPSGSRGR